MTLQSLPLELLIEIAKFQPWVGCELSKTIKKVGLYSLKNDTKKWFKIEEDGNTFILIKAADEPWYEKLYHSWDDNPAVINKFNDDQWWYKEGMIHRDNDKPAFISSSGTQYWYKNGKCHRDNDNPAIISFDNAQYWYKNGKKHRDGELPAAIFPDGTQEWWKDNKWII